jgi:hypothetical protein
VVPANIFSNTPPINILSKSVQFISEVFSSLPPSVGITSSVAPCITDTTSAIPSSLTAPAKTVFSPDTLGPSTEGTSSGVQGQCFSAYELSPSHGISSPVQDAIVLPQEANGLPPSVCDLICLARDKPVPFLQANPAHVSEPATVSSPGTAPITAKISPSALAATRFRDTHGPVTPPDPPWPATTNSLISPIQIAEPSATITVKLMVYPQTAFGWQHAQLRPIILR